jgi:hypothetical protein
VSFDELGGLNRPEQGRTEQGLEADAQLSHAADGEDHLVATRVGNGTFRFGKIPCPAFGGDGVPEKIEVQRHRG